MAESVKVIVRCRPMNSREHGLNCKEVIKMDSKIGQCSIVNPNDNKATPKTFTFDGAYFTDSTTEQIYADIGFPLVEGVTEGYNGTIFAYGQTGCGKSFSMQGITDPPTQRGIIPRAFDHIFETIQVTENTKYLVHVTYLEIYNEEIRDLLGKNMKERLDLKEHPDKGVYVKGLSMFPCKSVQECDRVMDIGWNNRSTGATLMNAESSRSHSIFTIYLERCDQDDKGEEHIRAAKLNLVDLAGSERQAKTGATGDRLKEATKINLSLSALGNVISALVDGKSKHIPYRDSKLTRMLQDSLGGNTKTLMVACLSPADNNYDETLSTLRYANRAKNIKNKPKINEDPKDALLREYQEEINKLKAMLRGEIPIDIGGEDGAAVMTKATEKVVEKKVHDEASLEQEKQRIKQEYDSQMAEMKQEFESMKISKERLEEEMERLRKNYDDNITAVETEANLATVTSPGQQVPVPVVATSEADKSDLADQDDKNDKQKVAIAAGATAAAVAVVKVPVKTAENEVVYMTKEEIAQGLPDGSQLMTEGPENKLVPVTVPVQQADGTVVQMSQQEVAEGLPPGAEVMSVSGMEDIPSPPVMLVVPEKVPVQQENGEIVYMSQNEISDGLPTGAQVMKESGGQLVPVQVVPVKTIEGKIEHKTQEELTEGLAYGSEVMTTETITTATAAPTEPEKVHVVELQDGQIVHMTQEEVDKGLPDGADVLAIEEKKSKDKVVVKTAEGSILTLSKTDVENGLPPGMEVMSVHSNEMGEVQETDEKDQLQQQMIQHAVHLATVKSAEEVSGPAGPPTPSTSPTGETSQSDMALKQAETLKKLEKLQEKLVGGEQAKNEELKEKRRKRKRHVEERKRKLAAALANMEGEEIMLGIYDNIQDELKATSKLLSKEKDRNENLERDIKDLQSEFEFDRIDYLDTIRKQEQQIKWLEAVVDRIHPCLRRDCNYVNLDNVKAQSQWDEENSAWTLPKMTLDRVKLPNTGGVTLPAAYEDRVKNGEHIYDDLRFEDKYYQRLSQKNGEDAKSYFKSNRQEKLLNQRNQVNGSLKPLSNGKLPPSGPAPAPWQMDPLTDDQLRAAQVHGQISQEEFPTRKPTRLDALPLGGGGSSGKRKSKKKLNTMDQY